MELCLFRFERDEDASGVSGTGIVAHGVEFEDGTCAVRWNTATASTAVYASMKDIEAIHGHDGRTRIVYADLPEFPSVEPSLIDEAIFERGKRLARMERDLAAWEEFGV